MGWTNLSFMRLETYIRIDMTIDKSKLISAIESHLRSEYVGKSTSYPKNHIITDVRCEIDESEAYFEGGGMSYIVSNIQFLVKSPKGKYIKWIDADISY
jgi:DNA-directed RNA polymerase subunit E'/Rpb7